MREIKKQLEERKKYLLERKKQAEAGLAAAPEGSLRICSHNNRTQYYHRIDPKDFNGTYIREEDLMIAGKLAQKDYDKKVLCSIEKELNAIEKYFDKCPEQNAEQIYEKLHRERQKLIKPIVETEKQYVARWEAIEYCGKDFADDYSKLYTLRGERVRSKSELMIADILCKEKIPYRYEYPVYMKKIGNIYPDFTVLNSRLRKEWYWEHLGMLDDPIYLEDALRKLDTYAENGIFPGESLIITYETRRKPMDSKMIMRNIQHYLK